MSHVIIYMNTEFMKRSYGGTIWVQVEVRLPKFMKLYQLTNFRISHTAVKFFEVQR